MKEIRIVDTTLRDAHQCLWATRMTTAMMLPVAETMDRVGFDTIDLAGHVQFDVCVRYLKENKVDCHMSFPGVDSEGRLQGDGS